MFIFILQIPTDYRRNKIYYVNRLIYYVNFKESDTGLPEQEVSVLNSFFKPFAGIYVCFENMNVYVPEDQNKRRKKIA